MFPDIIKSANSGEKTLISAELMGRATWFMYFWIFLIQGVTTQKFYHWRICLADFR